MSSRHLGTSHPHASHQELRWDLRGQTHQEDLAALTGWERGVRRRDGRENGLQIRVGPLHY